MAGGRLESVSIAGEREVDFRMKSKGLKISDVQAKYDL